VGGGEGQRSIHFSESRGSQPGLFCFCGRSGQGVDRDVDEKHQSSESPTHLSRLSTRSAKSTPVHQSESDSSPSRGETDQSEGDPEARAGTISDVANGGEVLDGRLR
jgi:hypothetical protein